MDFFSKGSEVLNLTQILLKNISTPILILVWCITCYTILDIFKGVIMGGTTQLWSLNFSKGLTDAFFYVAITETCGRWIRNREFGVVVSSSRSCLEWIKENMDLVYKISLHKLLFVYLSSLWLIVFYFCQSILVHCLLGFLNYLVYMRVKGISEYPALPGSLTVIEGRNGYVNYSKNKFTDLEVIIKADWIPKVLPEEEKEIEDRDWERVDLTTRGT